MSFSVRDKIEAVKKAVSIVDVLKSHDINVPDSVNSQIRCPFHGIDAKPSARVYAETNTIYCWTCHKVWDVIAAEMALSDVTIDEALNNLVTTYNIEVSSQPPEISAFYSQAAHYQWSNKDSVEKSALYFGDKFKSYYKSIVAWRTYVELIQQCWFEYDSLLQQEMEPSLLLTQITEWYVRASGLLSTIEQETRRKPLDNIVQADLGEDSEDDL